jgi:hypothetical protein
MAIDTVERIAVRGRGGARARSLLIAVPIALPSVFLRMGRRW